MKPKLCFVHVIILCVILISILSWFDSTERRFILSVNDAIILRTLLVKRADKPAAFPALASESCTSRWYQGLNIEFNAFSVANFSRVTFLMDDFFKSVVRDDLYHCIFIAAGAYLAYVTFMSST